jgi:hypothetical protein
MVDPNTRGHKEESQEQEGNQRREDCKDGKRFIISMH